MHIIIVDDQASCRMLTRQVIKELIPETEIIEFGDPLKALEFLTYYRSNLLLLDYRMPGMDGIEFMNHLKDTINHGIAVVLISVSGDQELHKAALQHGVIDILLKPVRPRELRSHCKRWITLI